MTQQSLEKALHFVFHIYFDNDRSSGSGSGLRSYLFLAEEHRYVGAANASQVRQSCSQIMLAYRIDRMVGW